MSTVKFDHDSLRGTLAQTVTDMDDTDSGVDETEENDGVDPAVSAALRKRRKDTKDKARKGGKRGEDTGEANEEAEDDNERGSALISSEDTEVDKKGANTSLSGDSAAQKIASALNPFQSSTPMSQVNPYQNGYMPTPATATQYDLSNAPNKAALSDAIFQAVKNNDWNSGASGDDRPNRGGGTRPGATGNADDDAVLDIIDKYVNSDPPIPYAWGGGHGGEPGLSQGISDGGGQADKMGDYNKQGLDCSGFARLVVYEATGQDLASGTSESQINMGTPVSDPRPGDLVFPPSAGRPPMHVQVYVGNGQIAEAQQSGTDLMYSPLQEGSEFRRFE